jgi:hypothetical protein
MTTQAILFEHGLDFLTVISYASRALQQGSQQEGEEQEKPPISATNPHIFSADR